MTHTGLVTNPLLKVSKVITDAGNFITTLESNPAFQSDVAALLQDLPASIVSEAENDPDALLDSLATASTTPAWVSAIPTAVIESIETLAAQPLDADADVDQYVASLIEEPEASSVISVLMTNVPTSVQNAFESDPISFLDNLITASVLPPWASNVPAPIQSDLGSVINEALSIIDSDLNAPASTATVPPSPFSTGGYYPTGGYLPSSGFYPTVVIVQPTGTGSVLAFNGKATGSPIAFEGAAAPMKTAAAGAAALLVGAGIFANL